MKKLVALIGFAVCFGVSAWAQATNPPALHAIDEKIAGAVTKFSYWQGMLLPLTLVLVAAIKKWVALVPDRWLPWAAPIIGGLLDMAAQKFGLWTGNSAVGLAIGGLATWAHQALFVQPADAPTEDEPSPPNIANKIGAWFLIGALSFSTFGLTGCSLFARQERTVEAKKFDTFKSVYDTARQAYKSFKRECFAGKVTAANEALGDKAWNEFRTAYASAFRIGMENTAAPQDIIALKNQLVRILLTL